MHQPLTDEELHDIEDATFRISRNIFETRPDEAEEDFRREVTPERVDKLITALRETQVELDAARAVVEAARAAKTKHGFTNIEEVVNAYDAARAEQEADNA